MSIRSEGQSSLLPVDSREFDKNGSTSNWFFVFYARLVVTC